MNDINRASLEDRQVAVWLLVCCSLVFVMVVLGGVTRLTGSGLSMVDWKPVSGILPPLSSDDWQQAFEQYQQSPEFKNVNTDMDVDAFKGIFWLEYLHRVLGRVIGIVFLLPFLAFAAKGYIRRGQWPKFLLMFVLGGLQGVLGWYMVKSGLVDVPEVSQYRLTAHLVAAFVIYTYMFWVALSLLYPARTAQRHSSFSYTVALSVLIGTTIVSGGFVAGLNAGKIFNTFPMMGDYWIPPGLMALEPVWRNLFDNPATVQFDHRILAITTFLAVVVFCWTVRGTQLGLRADRAIRWLLAAVLLQVSLGILTLLLHVPTLLAAGHQAAAMLLFTAVLYTVHSLRSDDINTA